MKDLTQTVTIDTSEISYSEDERIDPDTENTYDHQASNSAFEDKLRNSSSEKNLDNDKNDSQSYKE